MKKIQKKSSCLARFFYTQSKAYFKNTKYTAKTRQPKAAI